MIARGGWMVRTAANPAVWTALAINALVAFAGVRSSIGVDGPLSTTALSLLALMGWVWGAVLVGVPFVGDLRSGYASLLIVRAGDLRAHVTGAVAVSAVAAVLVSAPAAAGIFAVDVVYRPGEMRPGGFALLASVIGLVALASSGAACAGIAGCMGASRGVAGSISIGAVLLVEVLSPPWLSPSGLLIWSRPRWAAALSWTMFAVVLSLSLAACTGSRRARLAL